MITIGMPACSICIAFVCRSVCGPILAGNPGRLRAAAWVCLVKRYRIRVQVLEERDDHRRVQRRQRDLLRDAGLGFAQVAQQQHERVAVRSNRVRARVALSAEIGGQEAREETGKVGGLHTPGLRGRNIPNRRSSSSDRCGSNEAVRCR